MRDRLIVLKLGGSVLRDDASLPAAVHEVYRWRREGWSVVVVVSALAGATGALLHGCRSITDRPSGHAAAAYLACGEQESASLLGLHLDRAGVRARVLAPASLRLVAEGPPLDADPRRLDDRPIRRALAAGEVVVVPGFVAADRSGRTVLLGRGGSDLTALFLASRLSASRCRLVKDVDGVYERDPAGPGAPPRRYGALSWDDALETDGSIVQHKALRFARAHALELEVGAFNATRCTRVGAGPTRFERPAERPRPLRVALLGLGTVGAGVFELLQALHEEFEVTSVLVRDRDRPRLAVIGRELLTRDGESALRGADVVVEALGGLDPARRLVERALGQGAHVVTANKLLVAASGDDLARRARHGGVSLRCSAAVGGSAPILERLASAGDVRRIRAVLNGTANFVLDAISAGRELPDALEEARERGFAERDASRDLSGLDAADKLSILARALHRALEPSSIPREPIDESAVRRGRSSSGSGRALRQVSTLSLDGRGVRARVSLEELEATDPLASVRDEGNAALIELAGGRSELVAGKGAGRWPTAESVVGDLLQIARGRARDPDETLVADQKVSSNVTSPVTPTW